jgi:translation initiation factor 1A
MADEFEENEFGDESDPTEGEEPSVEGQESLGRVRIPRGKEVLGKVETRAGANRMIVSCFDGKKRNCRVPGRLKRKLWIRPGNIVLIEPWEFEGDKKGDIIFAYTPAAIQWLERKGYLKGISEEF